MCNVESSQKFNVVTVRPTSFPVSASSAESPSAATSEKRKTEIIEEPVTVSGTFKNVNFLQEISAEIERPDLQSAKIVVSGGRGMKSKENFEKVVALADAIGAGGMSPVLKN